jgi:hypothetical protein
MSLRPDLSVCPAELKALDPNAEVLWPVFLKRTGIAMSVSGDRVIDNEGRHALIVRSFGIPSLAARLSTAGTEIERARIWWRESVACSEGDSIPDLSTANMYLLNPFIVTPGLKFPDPRVERLRGRIEVTAAPAQRGRPRKSADQKRASDAARQRRHRAAKRQDPVAA